MKKKINPYLSLGLFVFLLIICLRSCILPTFKSFSESNIPLSEYKIRQKKAYNESLNLFTKDAQAKLKKDGSYITKSKYAYSCFIYKRHTIVIHKVKISDPKQSIKDFLELKNESSDITPNVSYAGYENSNLLEFSYSPEYDSIVENIILSYENNLLQTERFGDTIINYNFLTRSVGVKYEEGRTNDMVFKVLRHHLFENDADPPLRLNIQTCIYKKGQYVYIITLYPLNKRITLDKRLIPELLGVIVN